MIVRPYERGDEAARVSIWNEATCELPRFKPATLDEIRRRMHGMNFDPGTHFSAVEGNLVIGYATFQPNGRVSHPWCRKGCERAAEPLLDALLNAMRARGMRKAFAAYRADWLQPCDFFRTHGFSQTREMMNFVMDLVEMPTPAARPGSSVVPLRPEDVPGVFALAPEVFRVGSPKELEQHLLHNPHFPPESVFILRGKAEELPLAAGVLVANAAYAHPEQTDPAMPCFRCGAFGTEGMSVKRVHGLFSFVAKNTGSVTAFALDLMAYAAFRLQENTVETFAAQVASDVPHLLRFYQQFFRFQGKFPIFERDL